MLNSENKQLFNWIGITLKSFVWFFWNIIIIITSITVMYFYYKNIINFQLILLLILLVLLNNIFMYFFTIYSFSKYTSAIKFFWYRVFIILWGLEFYLFFIFIFLYIICPRELKLFFDTTKQLHSKLPNIQNVNVYANLLLLLILLQFISNTSVVSNRIIINICVMFFILILIRIFLQELKMFYLYVNISHYQKYTIGYKQINIFKNDNLLVYNNIILTHLPTKLNYDDFWHKTPNIFILNIILLVKFLHLFLIILINFILISKIILNTTNNLTIVGVLKQNLIIILIFWALNYVIYFKHFFKYSLYGFYEKINFYSIYNNKYWFLYELYLI